MNLPPLSYNVDKNDTDWLHKSFLDAFDKQQRLQNLGGVQREHTLYGPQATRLAWIYPPAYRFLVKPQALLMPEVFIDDKNAADTSSTSTEAVDGDASYDSMGGKVISQWRDIFIKRGRREIDLVVTKKLASGFQLPLLVVEIKRDNLGMKAAMDQIEDYLKRTVVRCVALDSKIPLYGLLVVGTVSLRIVATWDSQLGKAMITYWDRDATGLPKFVETDSKDVNSWLLEQAYAFTY